MIGLVKRVFGLIAQRRIVRGGFPEDTARQQVWSINRHQVLGCDFHIRGVVHDAVGLPQSRTVEGIADRARIRKVRLLFARDDVARQRLPPALAQFVILLGQDQFADRQ